MQDKLIFRTDSYKYSHAPQYPRNTSLVYSYFESRGGLFDELVFFGLQYYIKQYLQGVVVTQEDIDEAERFVTLHMGPVFNRSGWEHVVKVHGGKLPILIRALDEGTIVPTSVPMFTVVNTCDSCFWITSFLETVLSRVWYPITIASLSRQQKKALSKFADLTSDDLVVDFKLHDFGARGVSSGETAALGGASHLVNFKGSDTVEGIRLLQKFYNVDMAGFSIPAAEHSTITSWTREGEEDAYANMLQVFPSGLVAVVSDSYNIFNAVSNIWSDNLKDKVLAREGTLIIRPDSGDNQGELLSRLAHSLATAFGYTINSKGYLVLNPKVRLIQGDGIDLTSLNEILNIFCLKNRWALDNIAFGSGGGLLQKVNRDTIKAAYKCSFVVVDGVGRSVYKDPITDPDKKSKSGRFAVIKDTSGKLICAPDENIRSTENMLVPVFYNGSSLKNYKFEEIRERASI